ncbi:proteinase T-like protein [Purpureocillium lilacinum]|uniref:Proteinase T-like protein n=1 Tax=Purpureocillium lilacinum TaxID=33203 RepID=A0A179GEP9_PURLI|nr:proteinase T-like protein [Purpureocillium lilacinum]OAQ75930.1 proteinase T-like protein [Purpureocillium lilacinum]
MRLSTFALALRLPGALAAPATKRDSPAPLIIPRGAALIPNQYIVKLKDNSGAAAVSDALASAHDEATHRYNNVLKGFAGRMDAATVARLRNDPNVDFIEQDAVSSITEYVTQSKATWGISRLSHLKPHIRNYTYDSTAGEGTCAFVLDTGVFAEHPDFEGRAKMLKSYVPGQDTDGHGHGTHVSGTIGSKSFGVAKKTKIYGVKVLDNNGNGNNTSIMEAMDWVAKFVRCGQCPKGVYVNLSLRGRFSVAFNNAAAALVKAGVFVGVSAGNDGDNAGSYSPGAEPTVCTVGASDNDDNVLLWSNYGEVVDVFAPGQDIQSTWIDGGWNYLDGTSMSTPHVVGLAAYLGALEGISGGAVCDRIRALANKGILKNIQDAGSPNLLVFNGYPAAT